MNIVMSLDLLRSDMQVFITLVKERSSPTALYHIGYMLFYLSSRLLKDPLDVLHKPETFLKHHLGFTETDFKNEPFKNLNEFLPEAFLNSSQFVFEQIIEELKKHPNSKLHPDDQQKTEDPPAPYLWEKFNELSPRKISQTNIASLAAQLEDLKEILIAPKTINQTDWYEPSEKSDNDSYTFKEASLVYTILHKMASQVEKKAPYLFTEDAWEQQLLLKENNNKDEEQLKGMLGDRMIFLSKCIESHKSRDHLHSNNLSSADRNGWLYHEVKILERLLDLRIINRTSSKALGG